MEFLLATSNQHKAEEFSILFDKNVLQINPAPSKLEVEENGTSFFENALIKAKAYYEKFKVPILSDDSGITVAAMPSDLGILSARFGGEGLNDRQRAELLLKRLEEINPEDRSAFFTCVLCFYLGPSEVYYFEGRMHGSIAYSYRGKDGFGYDPIFIPRDYPNNDQDLTVSELISWKNDNSHRALASKSAMKFFREKLLPKRP